MHPINMQLNILSSRLQIFVQPKTWDISDEPRHIEECQEIFNYTDQKYRNIATQCLKCLTSNTPI